MKQSLQILAVTFLLSVGCLLGFLRLVDAASAVCTGAPGASAVEVFNGLLSVVGFVGSLGSTVMCFICLGSFVALALDKNQS